MAMSYGKNSTRTSSAASPITTASFTIEANERVLVLMLKINGATARAGGAPSFASQTMTQASTAQFAATSPEAGAELWYLLNPPVGAGTASIPNTGVLTIFYTLATAKSSSFNSGFVYLDGASGANGTAVNPSPGAVSVTTYNAIGFAVTGGGWTDFTLGTPSGTNIAETDDGAHGGGEQYLIVTTPGSYTLSWTHGTSDDWGAVAAFFTEKPAIRFENYFGFDVGNGMSTGERIR